MPSHQKGDEIREAASACRVAFSKCVAKPALKRDAFILAAQGNFNLWCSVIRATKRGRSSMDHRLSKHHELVEDVCDLLAALTTSVERYEELYGIVSSQGNPADQGTETYRYDKGLNVSVGGTEPHLPGTSSRLSTMSQDSGSSDEIPDPRMILAEYTKYIRRTLDHLTRISLAIRRAGSKYRTDKEYTAINEEEYQDFERHLTCVILASFQDEASNGLSTDEKIQRVSDGTRLGQIQSDLVKVNIIRRDRIQGFKKKPVPKPEVPNDHAEIRQPKVASEAGSIVNQKPHEFRVEPHKQQISQSETPSTAYTDAKTATAVDSQISILGSQNSSRITRVTRITASQAYPNCPKRNQKGLLICPYCNEALGTKQSSKDETIWKAHVTQDILPYSCIVDGCDTPHEMYLTADKLHHHMLEKHSSPRWTCDYCLDGPNSNDDPEEQTDRVFSSADEWKLHTRSNHGDIVPVESLDPLADIKGDRMFGPLSCPLCDIELPMVMATTVHEHILKHLHEFSLRCLPQEEGELVEERSSVLEKSHVKGAMSEHAVAECANGVNLNYANLSYQQIIAAKTRLQSMLRTEAPNPARLRDEEEKLNEVLDAGPVPSSPCSLEIWGSFFRAIADVDDLWPTYGMTRWNGDMLDGVTTHAFERSLAELAPLVPFRETGRKFLGSYHPDPYHHTLPPMGRRVLGQEALLHECDDFFFWCNNRFQRPFLVQSGLTTEEFRDAIQHVDHLAVQSNLILAGQHGIGKTHVARAITEDIRQSRHWSVLWIDARSEQSIEDSYGRICEEIELPTSPDSQPGHDRLAVRNRTVAHFLTWTFPGPFIMVIDGLEDQGAMYLKNENMLPRAAKCVFLFTTTSPESAKLFGNAKVIDVPPLDEKAGFELFELVQGKMYSRDDPLVQNYVFSANGLPSSIIATAKSNGLRVQDSLKTQLNRAFQKSAYSEESFLPRDALESIINQDNVAGYCLTYAASKLASQTSQVIEYVCSTENERGLAKQVFSILVLMDEPGLIPGIVEENIRDIDLPLAHCDEEGTDFQLARRRDTLIEPLQCFKYWTSSQRRSFDVIQFQVKAAVFNPLDSRFSPRRTRHNDQQDIGLNHMHADEYAAEILNSRTVLPFTLYDGKAQIIAGTAKVVRVKIHSAHHGFNQDENEFFALKTLEAVDTRSQIQYSLEVKALMKIRDKKKLHLVELLTTFKHDNKYHLLFRWANGGNLTDLWNRPLASEKISTYKSVCWLAQQCWGIADGLHGIHNARLSLSEIDEVEPLSGIITPEHAVLTGRPPPALRFARSDNKDCGRHGDIKPPNILWFKQDENQYGYGCLKICDFGLTTFHTELTTKISPWKEKDFAITYTYAAPEWDLKEEVSRSFDIWSLGCVFLEFMTWELCGSAGVVEFQQRRSEETGSRNKFITDAFYCLEGSGDNRRAIVKHSVVDWTQHLKNLPQCSQYMAEFLDYVGASMVVVDKQKRHSSSFVRRSLSEMFRRCEADEQWAMSSSKLKSEEQHDDVPNNQGKAAGAADNQGDIGEAAGAANNQGEAAGTAKKPSLLRRMARGVRDFGKKN